MVCHNGMMLSPRDVEKFKRPGPGQYETAHAADRGEAFSSKLSDVQGLRDYKGMKGGIRKRTLEPVAKLNTKFATAPRTINFASIRPNHVVLGAQLISGYRTGVAAPIEALG